MNHETLRREYRRLLLPDAYHEQVALYDDDCGPTLAEIRDLLVSDEEPSGRWWLGMVAISALAVGLVIFGVQAGVWQ